MRSKWYVFLAVLLATTVGQLGNSVFAQCSNCQTVEYDSLLSPIEEASGVLTGNCTEQTGSRLGSGGEIGAYYFYRDSYMYIERGVLTYNTSFLDTNSVVDSVFMEYHTTSVSDTNAELYFVVPDSMFMQVPDWSSINQYSQFDSMVTDYPDSGLAEDSGPYRTELYPHVVVPGGYTVIGLRVRKDMYHCGSEGVEYIYLSQENGKEPRLVIYYHTNKKCHVIAKVYPQKAYNDGCRVSPEQVTDVCGKKVTFRVTTASGWKFNGWSGVAAGTEDSIIVELSHPYPNNDSLLANFIPAVLPVNLISAQAAYQTDGSIQLEWKVASTIGNQGFEIERKKQGGKYTFLAFVKDRGGTQVTSHLYVYNDSRLETGFQYTYRIYSLGANGKRELLVDGLSVFAGNKLLPTSFALYQNYPNPFNPTTTIAFFVKKTCHVRLRIFDLEGKMVATLVDERREPGTYHVRFSAGSLPAGSYLVRIEMGAFRATRKMILLK